MPPSKSEPEIEYQYEKGKGWVAYLTREIPNFTIRWDLYGDGHLARWDDYDDVPF